MASSHEGFARQILIDHIRHLSVSRRTPDRLQQFQPDRPPSYDDVVKDGPSGDADDADDFDGEPPSYIEAMDVRARCAAAEAAATGSVSSRENENHIVMIEVK